MRIDRSKINGMPLILGPSYDIGKVPPQVFTNQETLLLVFETDPEAIPPLLPEPFRPGKTPTVNILFADNNGLNFLVGGGYRFASISVSAQCDSQDGHFEGNYVLLLLENNTVPIINGREWLGMPKIYSDISSIRVMEDSHLRCEVSLWGHLLFGIDVASPFKEQNALVRKVASNQTSKTPAFGYKYIASLDGPPDADYPTIMWSDSDIKQLWFGKSGEVYIGNLTRQDLGAYLPLYNALKTLPIRKVIHTSHSLGSTVLRIDMSGRLR